MLPSLQEHILQAGTVDLDGSYLVQLAIFMVFAVILNFLVVKPLGRLQELRYARMAGARIEAEKMDLRAAEARNSYEGSITDARNTAVGLRETARDAATSTVRSSVEAVKGESAKSLEAGRAVLSESAEKSKVQLEAEVQTLATLIADELLNTKGGAA
ncbi:MAG: ATP synthase F0 subunit B [Myxococcota bacterium]